jgi:hypothetical protein
VTPIGYIVTALVAGLGPAIACRFLLKSAWRYFLLGAATMTVAAIVGGLVGGLVAGFVDTMAAGGDGTIARRTALFPVVFVAVGAIIEEASRFVAVRRLVGRPTPRFTLSDGLMFGTGFAGAEVIIRAGRIALQALIATGGAFGASSAQVDAFYPVAYVAIPVFHMTMSVFLTHMLLAARPSPALSVVLLAFYHGAANVIAMAAIILGLQEVAIVMWFLIAGVNAIVSVLLLRHAVAKPG